MTLSLNAEYSEAGDFSDSGFKSLIQPLFSTFGVLFVHLLMRDIEGSLHKKYSSPYIPSGMHMICKPGLIVFDVFLILVFETCILIYMECEYL